MEFIQCPHCQKQYAVNDKLRSAVGKRIRCKHCTQAFEIIIQQASQAEASPPPASAPKIETVETPQNKASQAEPKLPESIQSGVTQPEPDQFESRQPHIEKEADDGLIKLVEADKRASEDAKQPSQKTPFSQPTEQTSDLPDSDKKAVKKTASKTASTKKIDLQLLITIILIVTLIIATIGAYFFLTKEKVNDTPAKQEIRDIIPMEIIKPLEIKEPPKQVKQQSSKTVEETVQIAQIIEKKERPIEPPKVSKKQAPKPIMTYPKTQACKSVSASYWIRTNTLATTSMDTATYMKLLNQNLEQANEIRKLCKDKTLIGKIAKAARTDNKPEWIQQEINSLLQNVQKQKQ